MAEDEPADAIIEELGYSPEVENERLRKGYRDELEMANQIVRARSNEIILGYGNPAGIQGPDILSLGEDGLLARWDVKWRAIDRIAGPSVAAELPLEQAAMELAVWRAIEEKRVDPRQGLAALRLYEAGTYNIFTVDPSVPNDPLFIKAEGGRFTRS